MHSPRLLREPLPLYDVRDVEAHVRSTLDSRLAEWGAKLSPRLYEDALRYLLGVLYELALKYDATHGLKFVTYSRGILRRRVVDWYRSAIRDARYAKDVRLVSIDSIATESEEEGTFLERFEGERDELHRRVYDQYEEVLTRVALDS